jgi:hypothetical protein
MKKTILFVSLISFLFGFNISIFSKTGRVGVDGERLIKDVNLFYKEINILPKMEKLNVLVKYGLENGKLKFSDSFVVKRLYSNLKNGGIILKKCLLNSKCDPVKYGKLLKKYSNNYIYYRLLLKHPEFNEANLLKAAGNVSEYVMNKYFTKNGWTKIEGEIGLNGIDGLFVKLDKNGNIKDVLFVESKYNMSKLGTTKAGKQMSKEWLINNLKKLKNHPNNINNKHIYENLITLVKNDNYRSRLWQFEAKSDKIKISIKKITSSDDKVKVNELRGGEKYKINYQNNQEILLNNPENEFQEEIINWINEAIRLN